jgi:hypothetical protein
MRTFDLYNLVSQKMEGGDVGARLIEELAAGGGWLEVRSDSIELHN